MKGGTVIGLAVAAFNVLQFSTGGKSWISAAAFVVFASLLYGFVRRMAATASPEEGFPFSRCMGFVMAMMLFTGVITGVEQTIVNHTAAGREGIIGVIDETMKVLGVIYTPEQMDTIYESLYSLMLNPLMQVVAGIISWVIYGGVVGLFVSAMAQRRSQLFPPADGGRSYEREDGE